MNPKVEKTNPEFRHEEDNWAKIKDYAALVRGLLEQSKELIRDFPKTYRFIRNLATETTDVRSFVATVNPAYAAATVYFTGMVAISYHYSVEAKQKLQKAHFKKDDLQIIIDTEIVPIFRLIESLDSGEDMRRFCQAKTEIGNLFGNALTSLQTIRKDIEQQIIDSTSSAEKNRFLQWLSAAGAVGGTAAIALAAPQLATIGFFACPQAMAGSSALLSSILGFFTFRNNKLTHEETMYLLNVSRIDALKSEKVLGNAITSLEIICIQNTLFPERQLDSLAIYMPKELKLHLNALADRSDL